MEPPVNTREGALLDTSVIIDFPADTVGDHASSVAISTISLAELAFGLHTNDPLVNAAREQRYHWIVDTFTPIPFGAGAARIYGALCATVRSAGQNPRPRRFDLLIAAVAVAADLPLLTRNPAVFRHISRALTVIDVS